MRAQEKMRPDGGAQRKTEPRGIPVAVTSSPAPAHALSRTIHLYYDYYSSAATNTVRAGCGGSEERGGQDDMRVPRVQILSWMCDLSQALADRVDADML